MPNAKRSLVIPVFVSVISVLILCFVYGTTKQVVNIFLISKNNYVITKAALTGNVCRKYGSKATFDIHYNATTIEGRDGCMIFAGKGDMVTVYFNKHDLFDNGIISQLLTLLVGRWLLFLASITYTLHSWRKYKLTGK
jgi:hypothetical protein